MTNFTPTHVHKVTGEQFHQYQMMLEHESACDKTGERRVFLASMLTPIQPIEGWEPVPAYGVYTDKEGVLNVRLSDSNTWVRLPYPQSVRIVDGCRIERRKG